MREPVGGEREEQVDEPDPATIRAARGGDEACFVALVEPLQLPVWRFLVRMLGDPHLAEDVAQETFVKVFLNLGTYRSRSKFSTWVFQIARNTAIDAIRKRDRHMRIATANRSHQEAVSPDEIWRVELAACLDRLDDRDREVVVLVDVVGMSYAETSLVLDIPIGTVKSRLHGARAALTSQLRAEQ